MDAHTATRRIAKSIEATTSKRFPVVPVALVSGPSVDLVTGDPDQPFFIASIDKVMIAVLIAQLLDEDSFALDAPIGGLVLAADLQPLPAAKRIDNARDVTVRHLLSHTSGLPDVVLPPDGYDRPSSIENLVAHPAHVWTLAEFLQQAEGLPSIGRPGEKFLYSDTAYFLLIRIIEEARGKPFGEVLRERILEPAHMRDTADWLVPDDATLKRLLPNLAPFWLSASRRAITPGQDDSRALVPNIILANGVGVVSTANDLVRFQRELHGGRLCDTKWLQLFAEGKSQLRRGIYYGNGMVSLRFGEFWPLMRGYPTPSGGLGYTATHMFYYPKQRTHVILNYHAHQRMQASFQMHIRLAGLINRFG
ncbi:serine hydrolase domain-containing protein [Gulosibacter molinativorax]|nr:serine hydrolase domain-containing protein [Gulosibacter molinativorax]